MSSDAAPIVHGSWPHKKTTTAVPEPSYAYCLGRFTEAPSLWRTSAQQPVPFDKIGEATRALLRPKSYPTFIGPGTSSRGILERAKLGFKTNWSAFTWAPDDGTSSAHLMAGVRTRATTPLEPSLVVAGTVGYNSLLLGGTVSVCPTSAAVSKYKLSLGHHGVDHQAVAEFSDKAGRQALRFAYAHHLTPTHIVGAEVVHPLGAVVAGADGAPSYAAVAGERARVPPSVIYPSEPSFALGYARQLDNSDVVQFRWDNFGTLSAGYTKSLPGGEALGVFANVNTTDLSRPARYGAGLTIDGSEWLPRGMTGRFAVPFL